VQYQIRESWNDGITQGPNNDFDASLLVFIETLENKQALFPGTLESMKKETLNHELMHTFLLHHNCGNRDLYGTSACVGNWSAGIVFDPFARLSRGLSFCAQHVKAIRRADGYGGE